MNFYINAKEVMPVYMYKLRKLSKTKSHLKNSNEIEVFSMKIVFSLFKNVRPLQRLDILIAPIVLARLSS